MARVDNDEDLGGVVTDVEPENATTDTSDSADATVSEVEAVAPDTEATGETGEAGEAGETQATESAKPAETPEQHGLTEEQQNALIKAFTDEVDAVVNDTEGGRDDATGTLSVELVSRVKAKFAALPAGKSRKAVKDYLGEKMRTAMDEAMSSGDMDTAAFAKARSYLQLQDEATTAVKSAAPTVAKAILSPTEQLLGRALPVWLAASALDVPEGVDEDWQTQVQNKANDLYPQVQEYYAYLEQVKALPEDIPEDKQPKAPEVDQAVIDAFRIARGRSVSIKKAKSAGGGGSTTTRTPGQGRGDVGGHIKNAFANVAPGTFLTVSQIVNTASEGFGYVNGDKPSPGAVAARLFKDGAPHTTLEGIVPGYEDPNDTGSKKGARKAG